MRHTTLKIDSSADRPICSVLVPAYNRPEHLAQCINALTKSQRMDIEILVSEDASPSCDQSKMLLAGYNDRRLKCFFQENNLGWSDNRNFLISKARGEYLILIGDDDLLDLDRLLEYSLDKGVEADIIGIGYRTIDEIGSVTGIYRASKNFAFNGHSLIGKRLLDFVTLPFDYFHPFTMLINRRVFDHKIHFQKGAYTCDDILFLIDAVRADLNFYIIGKTLFDFRIFRDQTKIANLSGDVMNNLAGRLRILAVPGLLCPDGGHYIDAYLRSSLFRTWFAAIPCSIQRELAGSKRLTDLIPEDIRPEVSRWTRRNRLIDYVRFIIRKYLTRILVLQNSWQRTLFPNIRSGPDTFGEDFNPQNESS